MTKIEQVAITNAQGMMMVAAGRPGVGGLSARAQIAVRHIKPNSRLIAPSELSLFAGLAQPVRRLLTAR